MEPVVGAVDEEEHEKPGPGRLPGQVRHVPALPDPDVAAELDRTDEHTTCE